ncbi:MAG: hypothetical protein V4671_02625 [Armatimonadota bacterium]
MSQPQNACSTSDESADSNLLRQIKIAAPCSAKWETMPGGERVRSCAQCSHKVYNLAAMSSDEAANLIRGAEGRVCVRLYRRADGSVMTRDCPTGLRAVRQRVTRAATVSFASLFSILGLFSFAERLRAKPAPMMGAVAAAPQPVSTPEPIPMMGEIATVIEPVQDPTVVMGKISYRPVTPLPMVAPTPDAEKTFLPHESELSEIRSDPFAPVTGKKDAAKPGTPARP